MRLIRPRAILGASLFLAIVCSTALVSGAEAQAPSVSLAGEWAFRLDPDNKGIAEKWFDATLPDKIHLPGSTDEGGYGTRNNRRPDYNYLARHSRVHRTGLVPAGDQGSQGVERQARHPFPGTLPLGITGLARWQAPRHARQPTLRPIVQMIDNFSRNHRLGNLFEAKVGKGFDYSVRGSVWRDAGGASWHSQDNLAVTIMCPKGFEGKLYAHFHDWNKLGRTAEISFQGQDLARAREL